MRTVKNCYKLKKVNISYAIKTSYTLLACLLLLLLLSSLV